MNDPSIQYGKVAYETYIRKVGFENKDFVLGWEDLSERQRRIWIKVALETIKAYLEKSVLFQ